MEGMRFLVNKQRNSWFEVACSRNGAYMCYTVDRKFEVNILRDEVIWEVVLEYCYRKFS